MEFKTHGNTLFSKGKLQEAVDAYTAGVDFVEGNKSSSTSAGGQHQTATQPTDEDKQCLKYLYSNRSLVHLNLVLVDEALQDAECAIEADPTFGKAYARRAAVLVELWKFKEALEDIEKAESLDPSLAELLAEAKLRATGKKWVPNCYLKQQLELRKKHRCDYFLQIEVDGEDLMEPLRLKSSEKFARDFGYSVKFGKGVEHLASLVADHNGVISQKIGEGGLNTVLLPAVVKQLEREFGPTGLSKDMSKTRPGGSDPASSYFLYDAVKGVLREPLGKVPDNSDGMEMMYLLSRIADATGNANYQPILFPGAPKWMDPEFLPLFLEALEFERKAEDPQSKAIKMGMVPQLGYTLYPTAASLKKHATAMQKYRAQKFPNGRDGKCHGCGTVISDPDPQECVCGESYCCLPCMVDHWEKSHKDICNKSYHDNKMQNRDLYRLTGHYWHLVALGWFPCKKELFFTRLWTERGMTLENTPEKKLGDMEVKFHFESEEKEMKEELNDACNLLDLSRTPRTGTLRKMANHRLHDCWGKWTMKMSHPLPTDSLPRLWAKFCMVQQISFLADQLHYRHVDKPLHPKGNMQPDVCYDLPRLSLIFIQFIEENWRKKQRPLGPAGEDLLGYLVLVSRQSKNDFTPPSQVWNE